MARFNFKTDDIIGEFLPDVVLRRITLEDYLQDLSFRNPNQNEGQFHLEVDLEVNDVLDEEVKRITGDLVKEGLTRAVPAVNRPKREGSEVIDSALKVCVVMALSGQADTAVKRLLRRRSGQGSTWRDRVNEALTNTNVPGRIPGQTISNPTIRDALVELSRNYGRDGDEFGTIVFMDSPARSLDTEQYLQSAYELMESRDLNNNPTYRLPHTFSKVIMEDRDKFLSIFAFTYMDFGIFDTGISGEDLAFLNNLYGKISYTKVIENGEVNSSSMILLDSTGTPYTGPYHQMRVADRLRDDLDLVVSSGRYMKGRFHTPGLTDETQYLTPIMVPNYKVQDFRSFSRAEKDSYLPADVPSFLQRDVVTSFLKRKRSEKINARLDLEQDTATGFVSMDFTIDQQHILENYSKFSSFYSGISNANKFNLLRPKDYFRLVNVKVLRRRVTKRDIGIDRLGFAAKDEFNREEDYFLVAETGEPHPERRQSSSVIRLSSDDLLIPVINQQFEISDESYEDIISSIDYEGFRSWLGEVESSDRLPSLNNDGSLPFPLYRKILVTDKTLFNVFEGIYQYGIELTYEDPIEKYLEEVLQELKDRTSELQEYYNECTVPVFSAKFAMHVRTEETDPDTGETYSVVTGRIPPERGSFNYVNKSFSPSFIERARDTYDFRSIAESYVNAFTLVQSAAAAKVGNIPHDSSILSRRISGNIVRRLIQPENSRPEQILLVLNSFVELQGLLEDIVDIDLVKDTGNIQLTPAQAGSSGRAPHLITVQRWFSNVSGDSDVYVNARERTELNMKFLIPPAEQSMVEPPEFEEENQENIDSIRQRAIEYIQDIIDASNNPSVKAFGRRYIDKIVDSANTSDEISGYVREFESALREGGVKL